jgi:hypothetical protein
MIPDKNPFYIPKNLFLPQGTNITFLNADAPWDTPHPETIEVTDSEGGRVVYSMATMDYTNSSKPASLPVGNYTIVNAGYDTKE